MTSDGKLIHKLIDEETSAEIELHGNLRAVLDAIPFYVLLVDRDHRIQLANKTMLSILNLSPGEEIGLFCPRAVHGIDSPYPGCPLEEAVLAGAAVDKEMYNEQLGRWFESGAYPTNYLTEDGRRVYLHMVRDITEVKQTGAALQRNYLEQTALGELLKLSLTPRPMDELLQEMLDLVLQLPWLDIKRRGAIFLVGDSPVVLEMRAQSGLVPKLLESCRRVPFGKCLCGRAAATREIVFAQHLDERHHVTYDGIVPHGHYCVPFMSDGKVIGVFNTYLQDGHLRDPRDESFLSAVADMLAGFVSRRRSEDSLAKALARIGRNLEGVTTAISTALEVRDPYTAGHQVRVTALATAIATEIGFTPEEIEIVRIAAQLHDIGKLKVPSEILSKPGKLSPIEFELIKTHSQVGYDILRGIDFTGPVAEIVYQHHEKLDGTGYPRRLQGNDILAESRILSVADVVEAVASHRPYRPALGIDHALEIIEKDKGKAFDPAVVDACLRLFREKGFTL